MVRRAHFHNKHNVVLMAAGTLMRAFIGQKKLDTYHAPAPPAEKKGRTDPPSRQMLKIGILEGWLFAPLRRDLPRKFEKKQDLSIDSLGQSEYNFLQGQVRLVGACLVYDKMFIIAFSSCSRGFSGCAFFIPSGQGTFDRAAVGAPCWW